MAGPGQTPRRSTRTTRGGKSSATPVPPTAPTQPNTPTPPKAPTPGRTITTRRRPAQRPAAPARQSFAYGSPGRSTSSIALAAATANQTAARVIAAGVSTARGIDTTPKSRSNLSTVLSNADSDESDPDESDPDDANPDDSDPNNADQGISDSDGADQGVSDSDRTDNTGGSPVGSPIGSPVGTPIGTPIGTPAGSRPASPAGVQVQISKTVQISKVRNLGRKAGGNDPFTGSAGGSGALTGNETPMGEGYSRNFGTEGPVGGNVGLGNTPEQDVMAYPPLLLAGTSPGALRGISLPDDTPSRPVRVGGSLPADTIPRPAKVGGSRPADITIRPAKVGGSPSTDTELRPIAVSRNLPADSPLRAALPNMTEEQLIQVDRIRSEKLAHEIQRKWYEEQAHKLWAEPFWANIAKVLMAITFLWVAYHAFKAAPSGFRWASNQYHTQTAWLKENGTFFHRTNTSVPHSTLNRITTNGITDDITSNDISANSITTNEYSDIMSRLTTMQKSYDSLSAQKPQPIGPDRVNYFSRGLGATIDPHLTSPTRKLTVRSRSWFGLSSYELRTPDPITAILPWADIGDCWCAPPSGGKAQLTVLLPRKIVPTHLVIEHIPQGATLDIGSAPREVELWVQIEDPEARVRVIDAALTVPTLAEESLLSARTLPVYGAAAALDKTWIRIGRWEYDIFAANHVQSFAVPVELDHFQVAVDKVSVRVRKNWGMKDYTCLYRLKMHGLLAEKAGERDRTDEGRREEEVAETLRIEKKRREELERRRDEGASSSIRQEMGWTTTA
ncbi:hypothetical protein MMC18_007428 [Xylographa bjoerkii]|nr:hypothetical protein [Xylographa bjoerkii]